MERLTSRILTSDNDIVVYTKGRYIDTVPAEMDTADIRKVLRKLAHYEDLEEQGLLLRLPCKYNDDLYWIGKGYVKKCWFKGLRCDRGFKPQIIAGFIDGVTLNAREEPIAVLDNIGKTVFLTREEAERKLKELQEKQ